MKKIAFFNIRAYRYWIDIEPMTIEKQQYNLTYGIWNAYFVKIYMIRI